MLNRLFILLIGIAFVGCNSPEKEIIGKWKFIKEVKDEIEVTRRPPIEDGAIMELEFSPNGEVNNLRKGELFGLIGCKYEIKGDSTFRICDYDTQQEFTIGAYFKLNNDTLILEEDSVQSYYVRN